jgi:hypothetical protein
MLNPDNDFLLSFNTNAQNVTETLTLVRSWPEVKAADTQDHTQAVVSLADGADGNELRRKLDDMKDKGVVKSVIPPFQYLGLYE